MPAINQGYGGGAARRTPESKPWHAPLVNAPAYHPPAPSRPPAVFKPTFHSEPFRPAQRQAQRRVVQAQRALPKQPTPQIPRIPNPSPAQTHAALALAHNSMRAAVGPNPSTQRIAQYQRELANDPRQRPFLETLRHYTQAAEGHLAAMEGRRVASGNRLLSQAPTGPGARLSRQAAVSLGRQAMAPSALGRAEAKPLPAPKDLALPLLGLATVRVPGTAGLSRGVSDALAAITPGLQGNTPEATFMRNLLGDVKAVGTFPFVGGYKTAEAGVQAAKGNTAPAKQLASGVAKSVEEGAVGQLVQGNLSGVGKAVQQHPLISALEAVGAGGVVGRSAGALARGAGGTVAEAGARGALARVGSTVRSPLALTDEAAAARRGLVHQREGSPDLIRKMLQSASDRRREPIRDAQNRVVMRSERGRQVPVLKASPREQERLQRRLGNEMSAQAAANQRGAREAAGRATVTAGPRMKGTTRPVKVAGQRPVSRADLAHTLSLLRAEGVLRTAEGLPADLSKRIEVLERAVAQPERFRTKPELKEAQLNLAKLKAARDNPKVLARAQQIVERGVGHARNLNAADQALAELKVYPEGQLQRARLGPYAVAHMGAQHIAPEGAAAEQATLRSAEGKFLSNAEIEAHAHAHGVDPNTLAYLPHRLEPERSQSFFKHLRPGNRPVGSGPARTYAMFQRGSNSISPKLLRDELSNKLTTVEQAHSVDRLVGDTGLQHPAMSKFREGAKLTPQEEKIVREGGNYTWKEAVEHADRLAAEGRGEYLPIRAHAAALGREASQAVQSMQTPASMETAHLSILRERLADDKTGAHNVVLSPAPLLNQIQAHLKPVGGGTKLLRLMNAPFRMAVLPQPKWLTGNFVEPYFVRLPLSGSGINVPGLALDIRAGGRYLKTLERGDAKMKQAAVDARNLHLEGMFIGRKGASVHTTYQDFSGEAQRALWGAHVVRNLPVVKEMGDLVLALPKAFFAFNRHVIESPLQKAALGKAVRRDLQAFTGSWLQTVKLGQQALDEVARGSIDTATQHRFLRYQHQLLGQYDAFGPALRHLVQGATPFLPWTLASMRFVYWTLPAHHTVAFDAFMKAGQAVMPQWEAEHKEAPPGSLRWAPRNRAGGFIDLSKYTPFGISIPLAEEGPKVLTEPFLPQSRGALLALEGRDPFGRELQTPGGKPSKSDEYGAAANQLLESLVPGVAIARRLQEKGGTGYGTSTVFSPQMKPGTSHQSAVSRTLNPFRATYLKAPKGGSGQLDPLQEHLVREAEREADQHHSDPLMQRLIKEAEEEADRQAAGHR